MDVPHVLQTLGRGAGVLRGNEGLPLASCLRCWVRGVPGPLLLVLFRFDQSVRAVHSAYGATARPQVGAVSDKRAAKSAINRQLPSHCSKNQSRRSCSDVSNFSSSSSTLGRTASITSHAKLSRLRRSLCNTPIPGSSPSAASANRDSDSRIAYR